MSACETPWLTITKKPTFSSVSRTSTAVASSAPGAPAKDAPKSMIGIVVARGAEIAMTASSEGRGPAPEDPDTPLRPLVPGAGQRARRALARGKASQRCLVELDPEPGATRHR